MPPIIRDIPNGHRELTGAERQSLPDTSLFFHYGDGQWRKTENPGITAAPGLRYCIPVTSPIPDSGARTNFDTGAVRDAASGKGLYSRIPPIALRKLAKRFEDGAIKYPDGDKGPNWMQGIPLSRFYDAIQRHSTQAAEFDTSEDHLGAVLWNAAAWAWTEGEITAGRLPQSLNDLPFHAVNRHTGL